jgi:hypothetical protein
MHLSDFSSLAKESRDSTGGFSQFRRNPHSVALGWPDDVLEQWLYDHSDNGSFLEDYGGLDLTRLCWDVEVITVEELLTLPTGSSDAGCIDDFAADPDHWVRVRREGVHMGVSQCWEIHGTWKRWPILIDRQTLNPTDQGLQVVEGRTRVGVLKGRYRLGRRVADHHLAWVGRLAT